MKKAIKRMFPIMLCCMLVFSCVVPAVAANNAGTTSRAALDAADALHALGLFNGTGTDAKGNPIYELERSPNRHEAVTMLVRLLGKEAIAEASPWTAPFTDVAFWAKPYVGYAYEHKITQGTSATTYGGSANTTATQYLTFMLRTLGYSSDTDFKWDAAWVLSDKIGMTNGQYNASTKTFTRGDMAIISYSALFCEMTSGITLYEHLVAEGAIADTGAASQQNNGAILTPYLVLHFDTALADHVSVVRRQGEPYILEFYAVLDEKPKQHVFDITFGKSFSGNLGTIKTDLGEVSVGVTFLNFTPDKSWTADEINTVLAVQEAANGLIEQLMVHQVKPGSGASGSNQSSSTKITTPYCTLNFPEQWKDYLQVVTTDSDVYKVTFGGTLAGRNTVVLFSFIFGGDSGEQIGVVKNSQGSYVPVNVVIEDLGKLNYSDAEMAILYEMQEALNILIGQLPLE